METLQDTLKKNEKQKEFYNKKKKSLPSRIWSFVREKSLKNIRKELGILEQSYALHQQWMGDLSNKRVLDLGCYSGNSLSRYMATNCKTWKGNSSKSKHIGSGDGRPSTRTNYACN